VADGTLVRNLSGHTDRVSALVFTPDGLVLVSGSSDRTIKLWRAEDGALLRTLSEHTGAVLSIACSPDGQILASGSDDQSIKLWRVADGTVVRSIPEPNRVDSVAFSPDARRCFRAAPRAR